MPVGRIVSKLTKKLGKKLLKGTKKPVKVKRSTSTRKPDRPTVLPENDPFKPPEQRAMLKNGS